MSDILLTPNDLAARWQISVKTLANWRCAGIGPVYIKLSGRRNTRVMYREIDIVEYEQKHTKGGEA